MLLAMLCKVFKKRTTCNSCAHSHCCGQPVHPLSVTVSSAAGCTADLMYISSFCHSPTTAPAPRISSKVLIGLQVMAAAGGGQLLLHNGLRNRDHRFEWCDTTALWTIGTPVAAPVDECSHTMHVYGVRPSICCAAHIVTLGHEQECQLTRSGQMQS